MSAYSECIDQRLRELVRVLVDGAVTFQEANLLSIPCFKAALYVSDMLFRTIRESPSLLLMPP